MTVLHAFLLGIIQGLTEFIPVSSTAHLLISQTILNIPADDAMFSFLVIVQLGTIVSLLAFYWKDLLSIIKATLDPSALLRTGFRRSTLDRDLGFYIIIATIPALLAGYLLKDAVESMFRQPMLQASIRLFSAAILLTSRLLQIMLPSIVFSGIAGLLAGLSYAHQQFLLPSVALVVNSLTTP